MTLFVRRALIGAAIVLTAFIGEIIYAGRSMPGMLTGSKTSLDAFFTSSKRHENELARAQFTANLCEQLSTAQLQVLWKEFETQNGPIKNWKPADASVSGGGRVVLWPRSVDYLYRVYGTKGNRVFYARLVPQGEVWRIDRLNIMR